jgi:hypothetical protein
VREAAAPGLRPETEAEGVDAVEGVDAAEAVEAVPAVEGVEAVEESAAAGAAERLDGFDLDEVRPVRTRLATYQMVDKIRRQW